MYITVLSHLVFFQGFPSLALDLVNFGHVSSMFSPAAGQDKSLTGIQEQKEA
jgi:hypothetical protein